MSVDKKLTNIANAIHAANKINSTYQTNQNRNSEKDELETRLDVLRNSMSIIKDYCPDCHKEMVGNTYSQTSRYTNAILQLRRFAQTANTRNSRKENFVSFISILHPIVDDKKRHYIEKIIKLYDVLHN